MGIRITLISVAVLACINTCTSKSQNNTIVLEENFYEGSVAETVLKQFVSADSLEELLEDSNVLETKKQCDKSDIILLKYGVPVVEQCVKSNTVYEIRDGFDLGGKVITIPSNSCLIFNGGSFSNGSIVFQNTTVSSNSICFNNITSFAGSVNDTFNLDWVDISETNNVTGIIQNILDVVTASKALLISKKERIFHVMNLEIQDKDGFKIDCNCTFKFPNYMPAEPEKKAHNILRISGCSDFMISTLKFDGNSSNNYCFEWNNVTKRRYDVEETNFKNEYRSCLSLYNCHNGTFKRIEGLNPCGDIVYLGGLDGYKGNSNLTFKIIIGKSLDNNGKGRACGRNVVSVINGNNIFFDRVFSFYVGHATMPGGFDIEPNHDSNQYCDNITVNKIYHEGKSNVGLGIGGTVYGHVKNIIIHEAIIKNHQQGKEQRPVDILGVANLRIDKLEIYPSFESVGLNINVSGGRPLSSNIDIKDLYIENANNAIQICNVENVNIKATVNNWAKNLVYFVYKNGTEIKNGSLDINAYSDIDSERAPLRFFEFESPVKNFKITGNLERSNLKSDLTGSPFYIASRISHLDVDVSKLNYKGYVKHNKIDWE